MVKKEPKYYGKTTEELKSMTITQFMKIVPSRVRRTLKRGFTPAQKIFMEKVNSGAKEVKTHCRDMIVIPEMLGKKILVHNGKKFVPVEIDIEKLGCFLGEFALTRSSVSHSAPGVGATRSSGAISVR